MAKHECTIANDASSHQIGRIALLVELEQSISNIDALLFRYGPECLFATGSESSSAQNQPYSTAGLRCLRWMSFSRDRGQHAIDFPDVVLLVAFVFGIDGIDLSFNEGFFEQWVDLLFIRQSCVDDQINPLGY